MNELIYGSVFICASIATLTWLSVHNHKKEIQKEIQEMGQLNEELANIMHTKILLARANHQLDYYISRFHTPLKHDVVDLMKEIQKELDRVTKLIQEGK